MKSSHKPTRHHKKPVQHGGKNNKENLSMLPKVLHISWHNLFKTYHPKKIARIINKFYLDPDYQFICVEKPL